MKRLVALAALALVTAGPAAAQQSAPASRQIAIVNIAKVLKNFDKAKAMAESLNRDMQAYAEKMKAKRDQITELQKNMANPDATARPAREQIEQQITALQREIEDVKRDARKYAAKKSDETLVALYKNIHTVIEKIAQVNGIDLVLTYADGSDPDNKFDPRSVRMKLQSTSAMPFYHNNMDITDAVVTTLNKHFRPAAQPTSTGTTPAAAGGARR